MADFPLTIKNQEELDDLLKDRLKRARETWEREAGIAEYRQQAQDAERRAQQAEASAYGRIVERDTRSILAGYGVTERGRQDLILRLVSDLDSIPERDDGEPDQQVIQRKLKDLHKATPEVFGSAQLEERGLDTSTRDSGAGGTEPPLSRERLENMSPEQINNSWDRIRAFLAGER